MQAAHIQALPSQKVTGICGLHWEVYTACGLFIELPASQKISRVEKSQSLQRAQLEKSPTGKCWNGRRPRGGQLHIRMMLLSVHQRKKFGEFGDWNWNLETKTLSRLIHFLILSFFPNSPNFFLWCTESSIILICSFAKLIAYDNSLDSGYCKIWVRVSHWENFCFKNHSYYALS